MPDNNDEDVPQERPTQRLDNAAYEAPASGHTRRLAGEDYQTNAAIAPQPVCGECGGEMIQAVTRVYGSNELRVQPMSGPGFLGKQESKVFSLVCSQCGSIRLYASDPAKLLE